MHYTNKHILTQKLGNNAFAWERRRLEYTRDPILHIPALINGTIDDLRVGSDIVFDEIEDGKLKSCVGLENFVQLSENMVVFDNHNHALYFWVDAVKK